MIYEILSSNVLSYRLHCITCAYYIYYYKVQGEVEGCVMLLDRILPKASYLIYFVHVVVSVVYKFIVNNRCWMCMNCPSSLILERKKKYM